MSTPATLRIAITSYYLPSESKIGAGWAAHRYANALVKAGHDVVMFSPCTRPDDALYEHRHVVVSGRVRTFRWGIAVGRIDFTAYDVLHAQGDDHLVRKRNRPPCHVRTLHGSCFDEARHIRGAKERLRMVLLGLTELVAAVRTPIVAGVSKNSIRPFPWLRRVIHLGVDTQVFHPGEKRSPQPTILFVGTYERRKRGRLLCEAFHRDVLPALPEARLLMVCTDAPAQAGVDVLGTLTEDDLAQRYRDAWLFCLPSTYEGFGLPYIEALASGTPVVATPNPGANELLTGRASATLVDDARLGPVLRDLLRDRERLERMRDAAEAEADTWSWESVVEQYTALYIGADARDGRERALRD